MGWASAGAGMSCHFGKSCPLGSFTPWENLVQMWFVFTSAPWLRKTFRPSSYWAKTIFLLPTCQPCPKAPCLTYFLQRVAIQNSLGSVWGLLQNVGNRSECIWDVSIGTHLYSRGPKTHKQEYPGSILLLGNHPCSHEEGWCPAEISKFKVFFFTLRASTYLPEEHSCASLQEHRVFICEH